MTQVFDSVVDILLFQPSMHEAEKKQRLAGISVDFIDGLIENHIKIQSWKVIDPSNLIEKIHHGLQLLLRALFDASRDDEVINEQDPFIITVREQMDMLRDKLERIGGQAQVRVFDAKVADEMEARRMLFSLRQEQTRRGEEYERESLFDFIQL